MIKRHCEANGISIPEQQDLSLGSEDERKEMLETMISAAAVKRARIIANGSRFHVEVDAPGRSFTVETGAGGRRIN